MNHAQSDPSAALAAVAHQLGLQPAATQAIFNYCLCQMMAEAGQMRLVAQTAGDTGRLLHFLAADGELFVVPEPDLSPEQLTELTAVLRQIWLEESDGKENP